MPIKRQVPPPASVAALHAGLDARRSAASPTAEQGRSRARTARARATAAGDVQPSPLYSADLRRLAQGRPLAECVELVGWRYLVPDGEGLAAADVAAIGGEHRLVLWNQGPFNEAMKAAVEQLEHGPDVGQGQYELRALTIPGLALFALWLEDESGSASVVVPLAPTGPGLEPDQRYSGEEFQHIVAGLARRRLARPDPARDVPTAATDVREGAGMTREFKRFDLDQFADLLDRFTFDRRIDAIHMHHTWHPTHAEWRGEPTVVAMWRYHTETNGWRDIAQHITIAPDGGIWEGRDWNSAPASAFGYNGNAAAGPFMFETVGNFDRGHDRLEGRQLAAVVGVIARLQERFVLEPGSLRFHNTMSQKTCPGTSIDIEQIKAAVADAREALRAASRTPTERSWADEGSLRARAQADDVLRRWRRAARQVAPQADAELPENELAEQQWRVVMGATVPAPRARSRARELPPEKLAALRPHVINLNQGRFSDEGIFRTTPGDVDAIFQQHLPRAAAEAAAAGRPLRVLFWAHGGLISEAAGLAIADLQVQWWKDNDIYPIHFVWETGLLDALRQLLGGTRDLADHTTDPLVEGTVRALGGAKIWAAMKSSARLASEPAGGAAYVAQKMAAFRAQATDVDVQVHAVGHSAGSIFHSHFLPALLAAGVAPVKSLQLLAPAIRTDDFRDRLAPHVGAGVESVVMYTMQRDWEESDSVAAYRKSLLYLIHHALERERQAPLLGLEVSLREDVPLRTLFGLEGGPGRGQVVWSVTQAVTGPDASTSRTHGGFDNNRPTMNAVAHRILGTAPAVTFPDEAIDRAAQLVVADVPAPLRPTFVAGAATTSVVPGTAAPVAAALPAAGNGASAGRRALCVGIDRYQTKPLDGCVADAMDWAAALRGRGFVVSLLLDHEATYGRILDALRALVTESRPGDVLAFQFAGHGTEVRDLDADESEGTNGPRDEALCPYDVDRGSLMTDDDVAAVFEKLPDGVSLTSFIDCCHSGSVTRVFVGGAAGDGGADRRARFLPATRELEEAHRTFRRARGQASARSPRPAAAMRDVLFAACRDSEVAYEVGGHGEFTVRALRRLASLPAGATNEDFHRQVLADFGDGARQHPDLDCAPANRNRALLGSLAVPEGRTNGAARRAPANDALANALRTLADALAGGA